MTPLNRFLAETVCGEDVCQYDGKHDPLVSRTWMSDSLSDYGRCYCRDCDKIIAPEFCTSFADCDALLHQVEKDEWKWELVCMRKSVYQFKLWKKGVEGLVWHTDATKELALCEAIARAYGYVE